MNLPLAVIFFHHNICTRRTVDYGYITVTTISALEKQRKIEAIKEPNTEAPPIDLMDVLNTYESLFQCLHGMQGGRGVLFSYVVRASN